MWIYVNILQLYFILLEIARSHCAPGSLQVFQKKCCNGILGYAIPYTKMPCSEMRCCNNTEIVALERVNHAVGFCFRCIPQAVSESFECFSVGQKVAATNETTMYYEPKTCCRGLKFKVLTNIDDLGMVIKCVTR